ncbi:MAG: TonB-dependent receptor plug domain-containing protein [Bacteroidetes bacterium]|nr:TonB-dependent receptor plug domain-containing protein [Bacteroidota bacterium]
MNKAFLIFVCLFLHLAVSAQKYTISGYVQDSESGEKMIMANVYDLISIKGTITNNYGFYSLTLPTGRVMLSFSYIGYTTVEKEMELKDDIVLNISLDPVIQIDEVVIEGDRIESKVESSQMSTQEIPVKTIKALPVLFGEVDIIRAIQLMPGVQSGNEGTTGLYVRGGGPDQNLILLDGVPVYNANHLFGFFSIFNADAVKSVTLIKGGFPARYGGRLSSVLDIRMKEGNLKKFSVDASIGLISSKLTIEGPIIKDKTSFIISGRRTYIDIFTQPLISYAAKRNGIDKFSAGYYFWDLNGKINHVFNERNRLFLSAYTGKDKLYMKMKEKESDYSFATEAGLKWGNVTTALRWNCMINRKLFGNTTLTYSRYKFSTGAGTEAWDYTDGSFTDFSYEYLSGIDDIAGKIDFDYHPNPDHYVRFGANNIYHTFKPGVNLFNISTTGFSIDTSFGNADIQANEYAVYAEDDMKIGALLKINAGLHYSGFLVNGAFYHSLQPRLSARYLLSEKLSVKAAYSQMNQYIHLLTNTGIGLPTDLWLPVTDSIKPMKSIQYAAGAVYELTDKIDISVEGYYKTMDNLIEYKEGASFFSSKDDWEANVEIGRGWSYGAEVLIEKKVGKLSGWIGYTLSWTERQFENISFGEIFPYKYDRRHDIGIAVVYKFNDRIDAGVTWVYGTGNAVTLATEKYVSALDISEYNYYNTIEYFEHRNSYRMPAYHRLDLGANFHKDIKWGTRTVSVGVYNAYNRKNPFFLQFEYNYQTDKNELVQYSLFPLIPSISYSLKF